MCVSLIFMACVLRYFFRRTKGGIVILWKMNGLTPYMGENLMRATITYHTIARVFLGTFEVGCALVESRRNSFCPINVCSVCHLQWYTS